MTKFISTLLVLLTVVIPQQSFALGKYDVISKKASPQIYCLAENIYFEARSSNLADMAAVADVVLNRTKDRRFPNTVCKVVHQGVKNADGSMAHNKCQFSWYCDGKADVPHEGDAWVKSQMIAYDMITFKQFRGITEGSVFYHASYVHPDWSKDYTLVGRIGVHIFYRWDN